MTGSAPRVLPAALLSGILTAAAAAQGTGPDRVLSAIDSGSTTITSANTLAGEQIRLPPKSIAATKEKPLAGNPLWTIPVSELAETRARPLFSPSRRPPAPPVLAALPTPPAKPTPPPKPEPDHPLLTLLGTIVGASMEIGVFVDDASHDVIRLKTGEVHDGWTLRSVLGRAAIFQKGSHRAATLMLSAPGAEPTAPAAAAAAVTPMPESVGTNRPVTGAPPVNTLVPAVVPAATKGGFKRPARES